MRRLALLVALAGVASSTTAFAQSMATSSMPSAAVDGDGIRLGDRLVLHLGIAAQVRYDSNVFYQAANPTQALILQVSPSFALATRPGSHDNGAHKLDFRIGAGLNYNEYLAYTNSVKPPRQFNITAGAAATVLPTGPVSIDLFDNYVRVIQPPYQKTSANYTNDVNEVGTRIRIKPGGGRLELDLAYTFGVNLWETNAQQAYDNYYHHSNIRLFYKFLPKTSVYIMADNMAYTYTHDQSVLSTYDRPNGYPLRVVAGLNGLLTAKLIFDIYGGYINGFYNYGPSPSTAIAGLSLTWKPFALTSLSLMYRHDAENTLLGVYADLDNVSAAWNQQIWRFNAFLRLSYQNTRYQGIVPGSSVATDSGAPTSTQTDNEFALNARLDYFTYKSWLALSVGYDFNILRSNRVLAGSALGAFVPTNFDKHEVYLGATFRY